MVLEAGSRAHGFVIESITPLPDGTGDLVSMVFEKTATPLAWIRNSQENKLFSIAFRTYPKDDTGVFHILEHTVLCGSEKYPVREPFVELIKSSVNTFLNALTFPDKTVYPVSSRNEKDFLNLASVYLDAVFAPNLLKNPDIFRQEGWHYEPEEDGLRYNGVVFNEMKGAFSSPDTAMEAGLQQVMFPDIFLRFNSGGDPGRIPELTYEDYTAAYRRFYHPSNAMIFLDGDLPIDRVLEMTASYLGRFEKGECFREEYQVPVSGSREVHFAASREDDPLRDGQVVYGKILGRFDEKTKILAASVLGDVLAGSNDAPISRAVLSGGLGEEASVIVADGLHQAWFTLNVRGIRPEDAGRLRETVIRVVKDQAEGGIDKKRLRAAINSLAFRLKETGEPQALYRLFSLMSSWQYGGDPLLYLFHDATIAELRAMAETDGYEKLLTEMFLMDDLCEITGIPSLTFEEEQAEAERAKLDAVWEAAGPAERDRIRREYEAFSAWQEKEDTPEQLATLPVLRREDIDPKPFETPTEKKSAGDIPVLEHDLPTNGIVYVDMYFPITDARLEDLAKLTFTSSLLGQMPTARHSAEDLYAEISLLLGSFSADVVIMQPGKDRTVCLPMITVTTSMLRENLAEGLELVREILMESDLSDRERIRENLIQEEIGVRQSAVTSGNGLAMSVAGAPYSASGAAGDAVNGLAYGKAVIDLAARFDERAEEIDAAAEYLGSRVLVKERMTAAVTGARAEDIAAFLEAFPSGTAAPESVSWQMDYPARLAVRIPAPVGFAAAGYHLGEAGLVHRGEMQVMTRIISFDYYWNAVRMSGGAYGCGMRLMSTGRIASYSYRDPSPAASIGAFAQAADFLEAWLAEDPDLTRYIVSTAGGMDPLVSPHATALIADQQYFGHITREDRVQMLEEILETDRGTLEACLPLLRKVSEESRLCVVAGGELCSALGDGWEIISLS